MGSKVFLSYAQEDADFARYLADILEKQGVSSFMADADLKPGEPWRERIREALSNADTVVVVQSAAALNSNLVLSELGAAWATDKPIISIIPPNEREPGRFQLPADKVQVLRADRLSDDQIAVSVRDRIAA